MKVGYMIEKNIFKKLKLKTLKYQNVSDLRILVQNFEFAF